MTVMVHDPTSLSHALVTVSHSYQCSTAATAASVCKRCKEELRRTFLREVQPCVWRTDYAESFRVSWRQYDDQTWEDTG